MEVDQRSGETRTNIATAAYHIDQWKYSPSGSPTGRFTLANEAVASLGVGGSIKCTVTTEDAALAADALYMWETMIEAKDLQHLNYGQADAKDITVSFWADAPAGNYTFKALSQDASRTYVTAFALAGSGLEKVTITVPGDTSGGITNDNGRGLQLSWTMAGGSNFQGGTTDAWTAEANNTYAAGNNVNMFDTNTNVFQLAKVKVEVGSVATDFEHEGIGITRAKCQRYYERHTFDAVSGQQIAVARIQTTASTTLGFQFLVEKRSAPTITFTAADTFALQYDGTTSSNLSSISADHITTKQCRVVPSVSSGLTVDEAAMWTRDGTDTAYMEIEAEL